MENKEQIYEKSPVSRITKLTLDEVSIDHLLLLLRPQKLNVKNKATIGPNAQSCSVLCSHLKAEESTLPI